MPTVCAFVLTRNRKQLLAEGLRALLAQTRPLDEIVVVDNASTDGTEAFLREEGLLERISFHRLEENSGGAGGYAEGVRLGIEAGRDWIWLMDDDAEPRPDALERLLESPAASDAAVAVLCSAVVHPDGSVDPLHRGVMGRFMRPLPAEAYAAGSAPVLHWASFVGFLVRTGVAREIGLPRAEFFIGCDDVDYSLRANEHGRIVLVPESEIVHKLGMGGGHPTRRSRFWNRVLRQSYSSASWEGFWKNLYGIRNFVWVRHRYSRVTPLQHAALVAGYVVKSLMYDERPLRRIPWILRFARAGRRGDFGGPTPAEWAEIARQG